MLKAFHELMVEKIEIITKTLEDISEDRREWLRYKVANSLLFGAGSAFFHHMRAPKRNEALLNQAITLLGLAHQFYQDNEDRFNADCESVVRYYSPKPPVEVTRKKGQRKLPAAVAKRKEEIAKRVLEQNEQREKILPKLEGFLNGAKYDNFDLQPSERDSDQAHEVAKRAFNAMNDRIEQDLMFCSQKWTEADQNEDDQACARWEGELIFVEADKEHLEAIGKQYNFNS